jgi:sugar (pentulose or hexulose) kinase
MKRKGATAFFFIGIDVGTSGCRALAIDQNARIVAHCTAPLPRPSRKGALSEQDPHLWWNAVCAVLQGVLRFVDKNQVCALSIDGTSSTVLLADARGEPLGPALMYDDTRASEEAERISRVAPHDNPAQAVGSTLAKLLHLVRVHSRAKARYALHQADWLSARLTGRYGISDENNCLKLGYDPLRRQWPHWLGRLELDASLLPEVVPAGASIGRLADSSASRFGLPRRTRVVAGTTDSTAAFLATGAQRAGEGVTSLGSTLVLKLLSPQPLCAPLRGVYSHRLGDLWLCGGASNVGGATLLNHFTQAQIDAMTPRLRPSEPTGLDYYPLPARGERFPVSDPELQPRLTPRPQDPVRFFQGMLEGIARIEAEGYQLLRTLGCPPVESVRTVGGGARNPGWQSIRARALGVPLLPAMHTTAAYGAALLALRGHTLAAGQSRPGSV